ncbi:hypothetical protein CLV58_113124 [Spirosoma oryzae]|uniref:Uncharacterized protein n=1 Tax=Spirosoma oryzae TaxID=1469603 RepID=A0A2T0SRJ2_9BACT|nr:hypothetical protein [Spirosoma oryzae]PRY35993.1 hypothetical protein CLV58_113124 [Spirosoma oryzae]
MKVFVVSLCLFLIGSGAALAQRQTYVYGRRTGGGLWVPGYYRPYAPSDIYRQRRGVVVIVAVPGQAPQKAETPAMPSLRDDSGGWVDGLVKQQATSDKAIDFMRRAGEK